jgi:hypothetical protein
MTAVAEARTALHEALEGVTPATWRVHRTAPAQITAPCVFIDAPSIGTAGAGLVVVRFPIVAIVDGAQHRQLEQLDELLVAMWDMASRVGVPTSSSPAQLDVGGPTLRAQTLTVEITVAAVTFCAPQLSETVRG